jgi:5-oxoprolinase (ATP-hydrolysing)
MGMDAQQAAEGIIDLVNEAMNGALRLVSVEQGFDPCDFALCAFGGAGPLHANALGKLLNAFPVIVPVSPGILCAQGDATTKMSHEQSCTYIKIFSEIKAEELCASLDELKQGCLRTVTEALNDADASFKTVYSSDMRYKGQAMTLVRPRTMNITKRVEILSTPGVFAST